MRKCDVQYPDSSCGGCHFVTKPEAGVRNEESESLMGANLIVHECIANVFHQAVEPLGILWVIEEIRRIVLGFYRVHSPANLFQFPGNPRASDSILDLGWCGLTVPALSLSLSH